MDFIESPPGKKELARRLGELAPEKRALLEHKLRQYDRERNSVSLLRRRADTGVSPLSFAQERLWFLWQLEPETPAYNRPAFLRLTGPLAPGVLGRALNALVQRHEVLRATFPTHNGQPAQVILPWEPQPLPACDLSGLTSESRGAELERLGRAFARQPFDLARGPMMRAKLVLYQPEEHVLLLVFHHIAFDAWSGTILLHELPRLYATFSDSATWKGAQTPAKSPDKPCPLPELSIQYADFAAWQRRCFETGLRQADLAYLNQEL